MICPFCDKKDKPQDNTHFDSVSDHIIITVNRDGAIHVHAPFQNEYAMRKMRDALVNEMNKNGIIDIPNNKKITGREVIDNGNGDSN